MLHLAMVRSPFAHATHHRRSTPPPAKAAPNVVAVITGADVADEQGGVPTAWPITPDQKTPNRTRRSRSTGWRSPARWWPWSLRGTAAEAQDAAELVDVDYEELPAALDLKEAAADTVLAHPDLGTNKSAFWQFDSAEAGTGGIVDEAIAKARADGIVIEREYRQQRLIPAFMEPRSFVVRPDRRADDAVVLDPDPAHPRFFLAAVLGIPERKVRVDRARRRRRLRRQAPDDAGGDHHGARGAPASASRASTPRPARSRWSPPTTAATSGRSSRSPPTRTARSLGSRSTCRRPRRVRRHGRRRRADPGRVHVQRDLQVPRLPVQLHERAHEQDAGPTPTAAPAGRRRRTPSSGSWTSWPSRSGVDPLEIREKNWIKHEEFPFTTVAGLEYDSGNYEAATAQGQGDVRVRRAPRRAEAAPGRRRPGPARHRHLDVHRDVRPGAVAGARLAQLRRRRLGARRGADAGHRQGRGGHRRLRPRPGPRDGVQPDRRRPARGGLRGRRGAARRHADRRTRATTPTARGRWWSVARRWSGPPTR